MIEAQYCGVAMCQLSLPGFEGTADAYLALVTQHKLSAGEVPVADITKQFLTHMTEGEHLNLNLAGELVAASARLMAMKSAQLLIQPEGEEGEGTLDDRAFDPKQRDRYRDAVGCLFLIEGKESFLPFTPPVEMERRSVSQSTNLLLRAWQDMHTRITAPERRLTVPGFVRLEVAVSGLIRALRSGSKMLFLQLVRGHSRNDTVVHFMALLELARQKRVRTEQEELFADITVQWVSNSAESSTRVG
jgi:segregation and condensation protein A